MTPPSPLWRNAGLFSMSFFSSGLVNAAPQRFFAVARPDEKLGWLAGTLLFGTVCTLLGVALSARWPLPARAGLLALASASLTAILASLFLVQSVPLYLAVYGLARVGIGYLAVEIDARAVQLAGPGGRTENDRAGTSTRLGGMLVGVLWVGSFGDRAAWLVVGVVLSGAVAVASGARLTAPGAVVRARADRLEWRPGERFLSTGAVLVYASFYMLAGTLPYLLRDLHGLSDATARAAWLTALVFASAAVSHALAGAPRGERTLGAIPLAGLVTCLLGLALPLHLAGGTAAQFLGCAVLGVAFSRYLFAYRAFATEQAEGRPGWLVHYNRVADLGALGGFSTLLALGAAVPSTLAGVPTLPIGIALVAGAACAASALGARVVGRAAASAPATGAASP